MKLILTALMFVAFSVQAAKIGTKAPEFTEVDANGKSHKLSDFKGKYVVLEWMNKDCPFVKKHYESSNMQKLQKEYTGKGVVWLTVVSSAKGKQGYLAPKEAGALYKEKGLGSTAVLIDDDGSMGKAYAAKVTPHMYVISPDGNLVYAGAIDDNDSSDAADIATSKNYVKTALDDAMAGRKIATSSTKAYGCGVKY